jgi:hypothetical protein
VRYIDGTIQCGCKYTKGTNVELLGYFDSDHVGDLEKRKSTTGVVFFLGKNIVTWTSQKQRMVSLSSCESEYTAASTTGVVFFLGKNIVTWTSQKQRVVSLSSCESEYTAAAIGTYQGVWLSRLLGDLTCSEVKKFRLNIDNRSAEELSKNPVYHKRSKHIDTLSFHQGMCWQWCGGCKSCEH